MTSEPARVVRVSAIQSAPVFLDREATVEKLCTLIRQAGKRGVDLIALGESFLPGHPVWFHALPPTAKRSMELAAALVENAITVPGPEVDALCQAAGEAGSMVVLGIVERPNPLVSVIYDSQLVISPSGDLAGVRRKIVPAVGERVFFASGGGDSIRVFESPWGPISVLAGGENSNPLLTYAMRSLGARIHVALWPPHFHAPGIMHNVMTITGRAVAYQNTAHVIAVAGFASPRVAVHVSESQEYRANLEAMTQDAGSVIYAPRGSVLAGPLHGEGTLSAEMDVSEGTWASLVNRQYDRPDLLRLVVTRHETPPGSSFDPEPPGAPEPAGAPADSDDDWVRRLIVHRFGDALSNEDVDELVPYVTQVLRRSETLAQRDPTSADPRATAYSDEGIAGR